MSAIKRGGRVTGAWMARVRPRRVERARARRGTVLVVEGGRTVAAALAGVGYRVLAASWLEALGMAHEVQPDVEGGAGGHIRPRGGVMPARGPARRPRPILS